MPHGNRGRKRPDLSLRNKENAIHGMHNTREYFCWDSMIQRCKNPNNHAYKDYGGRGINVCERWTEGNGRGFMNFFSDIGNIPKGFQLNRIDNDGNYSPDNCNLVTSKANTRNRRSNKMITFNGETKCLAQWAEDLNIDRKALAMRLRVKTVEEAFSTPYKPRKK